MQIAAVLLVLAAACARGGPVAVIHTGADTVEVALEVARTPEAQERGLMYRTSLADGRGMLFTFPDDADHQFWMKNTVIPLDMIFIAHDGRIAGIHADATPLSTAAVGVGKPSRFVLEVPGGYARRRGIAAGDRVDLVGVSPP
jgi:uncharacterized membrane protein (UPF0127 family)